MSFVWLVAEAVEHVEEELEEDDYCFDGGEDFWGKKTVLFLYPFLSGNFRSCFFPSGDIRVHIVTSSAFNIVGSEELFNLHLLHLNFVLFDLFYLFYSCDQTHLKNIFNFRCDNYIVWTSCGFVD